MSVYLRFIADRGPISRAIRWRTNGLPSHVEYVAVDGGSIQTFGARLEGGITHRPIDYCKPSWQEWYTYDGIEAAYAEALTFDGRSYDWADIVHLAVGWHPMGYDPERAICSCLVGYSNRRAFVNDKIPAPLLNPNLPTSMMTPETLYAAVTEQVAVL